MAGAIRLVPGGMAADGGQGVAHAGIWEVQLCHEGRLNAMSRAMWRELRAVFEHIQGDARIRCVLVRGAGTAFCAGGDISEYPDFRFDAAQLRHFHEDEVWGGLQAMLQCDVPLVAQIAGPCMGAGVEIASCCDLRLASATARFGAPIAKLGFPMAPREAALVTTVAGDLTARQMLLEAATFSAAEMAQRGFLGRVLADEAALAAEAQATAARIAALAPAAARMNKQMLRALLEQKMAAVQVPPGPAAMVLEYSTAQAASVCSDPYAYADSAEHREGIAAFLAKRPPNF